MYNNIVHYTSRIDKTYFQIFMSLFSPVRLPKGTPLVWDGWGLIQGLFQKVQIAHRWGLEGVISRLKWFEKLYGSSVSPIKN